MSKIGRFVEFLASITTAISLVFLLISYRQSTEDRTIRIYKLLHEHKQNVNKLLIENEETFPNYETNSVNCDSNQNQLTLSETILPCTQKRHILAYYLFNDYRLLFSLKCDKIIDDKVWTDAVQLIDQTLDSKNVFLNNFWQEVYKPQRLILLNSVDQNFVNYINYIIITEVNYKNPSYKSSYKYLAEQAKEYCKGNYL